MRALRLVMERLSRPFVLRKHLPDTFGALTIFTTPDAALRHWRPGISGPDLQLLSLVEELVKPGMNVWDLGANVGVFSLAASWRAGETGHVLAVEPDGRLVALLQRSVERLPATCATIATLRAAVGKEAGTAELVVASRGREANFIRGFGSSQTGGERSVEEVPVFSLGELAQRHGKPDLVKIDVEGAELEVLLGGRPLLGHLHPIVLCEVASPSAAQVGALLQDLGYELFDASLPAAVRRPLEAPAWNTLAIPRSTAATTVSM